MQLRENSQFQERSLAETRDISQRVTILENELEHMRGSLDRMEKHTLGAIVKDANNSLVTGWAGFMQAMEREVGKAAEAIERELSREFEDRKPAPQTNEKQAEPSNKKQREVF
jgi:hypothetical protein